ncbi:hypothetical protein PG985_011834 [Apiospora marii]|uniref:Uncharacterized protein n=1 Tax=Apiospora marii TaxID=335849 RepID=A0ABR1R0U4_9PEZI
MPSSTGRTSSSGASTTFRSGTSSTFTKEATRSSKNVIVHEHARGYDRNEPTPPYSSRTGGGSSRRP